MSASSNKRNLLVLGMHRSGTSMIARAVTSLGFKVGSEDEVLAVQPDNPRGYFERRDVVALNERVLRDAEGSWYKPASVSPDSVKNYSTDVAGIVAGLGPDPWVIKDPRMTLTWPVWTAQLGNPVVIYAYRNPESVARSLEARNGFPLDFGLALWESYNLRALAILAEVDFVPVNFDAFAAAPAKTLSAIRAALVGFGIECATPKPGDDLFDASLDNSPSGDDLVAIAALKTDTQSILETACLALIETGKLPEPPLHESPALLLRLKSMGQSLVHSAHARQMHKRWDNLRIEHNQLLKAHERDGEELLFLRERFADDEEAANKYAEMADKYGQETANYKVLDETYRAAQERLGHVTVELDELIQRHETSIAENNELRRNLAEVRSAFEARSQELIQRDIDLASSNKQLVAMQADRDHIAHKLDHSYQQVNQFVGSGIGRVVVGLVALYRFCTLRGDRNTAFDDVVAMAARHATKEASAEVSTAAETGPLKRGRLGLLMDVFGYVRRNPYGSFRSFSLPRLRRALQIFVRGDSDSVDLWVRQRFPTLEAAEDRSSELILDESLDTLCLDFPEVSEPLVSIIVPVFNQYRMTINCLRSVLEHTAGLSYEIILADDCSSDLTGTVCDRISGLRLSRTPSNVGFLRNCNAAAVAARGSYLLFLNNDTAVTEGWLSALLETFRDDPKVGIAGPKLLFGSGELQEAGGIIWDDGSGWNYGRLDDRDKPAYNYRKEVDYVSGACLMVRTDVWKNLGGFDERYAPAYYEDTDLCFAARGAGYKVVYQPESVIYHYEGMSNGTDLESGIKHYQVQNQAKFVSRWKDVLGESHFPNGQSVFRARDRSAGQFTVLVIDHYVPSYDKDAGSRSTMMYLRLMVEMGYRVVFLGANFFPHQPYTVELERLGIEVLYGEYMARHIQDWLQDNAADIGAIYLHRPHVAEQFLPMLKNLDNCPKIIYFGHDLHYLRTEREAQLYGDNNLLVEAQSWKEREHAVFGQVDQIYYPSQSEVDEIHAERPDLAARTIPLYLVNGVEPVKYEPSTRSGMLFVGGFNHPPNVDGVRWLIEEILPKIRSIEPDLELHIVGSNVPDSILALAEKGVNVYGFLSDEALAELYCSVRVVVVPLRYGAGVKGKVIEALQWGLPVVTTDVGAEGIPHAGEMLWIGNTPEEFAVAAVSTYRAEKAVLDRLAEYPAYLQNYYSKERARDILIEDFGNPNGVCANVSASGG